VSDSLRERVEAAMTDYVRRRSEHYLHVILPEALAADLTEVAFRAMGGARPCVTCGKGLGPAKVAKGYVQCYDCTRRHPL
jgi:hypothetical protein